MNAQYDDTGTGMQYCFASIRSRTMSDSVNRWNRPLPIFSESAQRKKEDCSVVLSGCSSKHSLLFLERSQCKTKTLFALRS